jgi:hypothetical protein
MHSTEMDDVLSLFEPSLLRFIPSPLLISQNSNSLRKTSIFRSATRAAKSGRCEKKHVKNEREKDEFFWKKEKTKERERRVRESHLHAIQRYSQIRPHVVGCRIERERLQVILGGKVIHGEIGVTEKRF